MNLIVTKILFQVYLVLVTRIVLFFIFYFISNFESKLNSADGLRSMHFEC